MATGVDLRLLNRIPSGMSRDEGGPNHKWLQVISTGGYGVDYNDTAITDLLNSRFVDTAAGGALDNIGYMAGVGRRNNELDVDYRVRIKAGFKAAISKSKRDEIIDFVAASTFNPNSAVKVIENIDFDTQTHRGHYYYVTAPIDQLALRGVDEEAEIDAVVASVSALLTKVDAAGVRGEFVLIGDFTYEGDDADLGASGVGNDTNGYQGDGADFGSVRPKVGQFSGR